MKKSNRLFSPIPSPERNNDLTKIENNLKAILSHSAPKNIHKLHDELIQMLKDQKAKLSKTIMSSLVLCINNVVKSNPSPPELKGDEKNRPLRPKS